MAAKGVQFPWRWDSGTISTNLDGIWVMSGYNNWGQFTIMGYDGGLSRLEAERLAEAVSKLKWNARQILRTRNQSKPTIQQLYQCNGSDGRQYLETIAGSEEPI